MLGLGLSLWSSTILGRGADPYAVLTFKPDLVFDFAAEKYRTGGSGTTFNEAITYTGASNKTMVDSDGLLKWAPHNLLLWSEDLANGIWTTGGTVNSTRLNGSITIDAVDGYGYHRQNVSYPAGAWAVGVTVVSDTTVSNIVIRWQNSGTSPNESLNFVAGVPQTILLRDTVPPGTSLIVGVDMRDGFGGGEDFGFTITFDKVHLYRSDLGGMVSVPEDARATPSATTYVPTTTAARYLPRRGHHVYNGSAWVNEGLLVESEARVNLITYSNDFTNASWVKSGTSLPTITPNSVISPDGTTNATKVEFGNSADSRVEGTITTVTSQIYTLSFWLRSDSGGEVIRIGTSGSAVGEFTDITLTTEWQRYSWTSAASSTSEFPRFQTTDTSSPVVYVYGAQFEAGSTPSSYIPTSGATVTRAAETLTVAAADLPYPTPRVIGPELVTNGTFDTDLTGWTINDVTRGTAVASGGRAVLTNDYSLGSTSGFTGIITPITTVVGRVYQYQASLAGTAGFSASNNSNGTVAFIATTGTGDKSVYFTATATTTYIVLYVASTSDAATANFDNISVREIDPLSVSIQMQGRVTYVDTDSAFQVNFLQWGTGANPTIRLSLGTSGPRTGQFNTQQVGPELSAVASAASAYSPGLLVPFSVASRHGSNFLNSAHDGTLLTAVTTPTALPNLSATNLSFAPGYMGTIRLYRMWDQDLGDTGIAAASAPSLEPSLSLLFDGSESSFTVDDWSE